MIALQPYYPELNPTELSFNTLLQRLRSIQACYGALDADDFLTTVKLK